MRRYPHPRPTRRLAVAATVAATLGLGAPVAVAPSFAAAADSVPATFTITDISLPGTSYSIGYGINEAGVSVIHADDASSTSGYRVTAAGHSRLAASGRPWAINQSGAVAGEGSGGQGSVWAAGQSTATTFGPGAIRDVADNGSAAGLQYRDGTTVPVRVAADATVTALPLPQGAERAHAWALNESGIVVGDVEDFGEPGTQEVCITEQRRNRNGVYEDVERCWYPQVGNYHDAIVWDAAGNANRISVDGASSYGVDVNERGDVLVLIDSNRALIRNADGSRTQLPSLGGFVEARRMNDNRQVVGRADRSDHSQTAFLYDAPTNQMIDLQSRIPADSGWRLATANDINNAGQIVGYGVYEGRLAAFKLTPIVSSGDSDGDGIFDNVDVEPNRASTAFSDERASVGLKPTSGSITANASNLAVTVTDAEAPDGVRAVIGSGTGSVTFSVCGFTVRLAAGSDTVLTCGSVRVAVAKGTAEVLLGGEVSTVTFGAGADGTVKENPDGSYAVVNHGTVGITVTVDGTTSTVTPSSTLASVRTWKFQGFSAPVNNLPTLNLVKAGQTVPLRWRLLTSAGAPVTTLSTAKLAVTNAPCNNSGGSDPVEEVTTAKTGLLNLGDGYYQMNWATPKSFAGTCKRLHLDIGDGVTHDALFSLTR
jgi:probable HAF family extracellular repeat protein